jgi:hypothetical protein
MRKQTLAATLIFAIIIVALSFVAGFTHSNLDSPATVLVPTPQPLELQVFGPQDNYTYGTYEGPRNVTAEESANSAHRTPYSLELPLNITTNSYATNITFSLDGADNSTLASNATLSLGYGVHTLVVYAFDGQGKVGEARNVTFTVGYGYLSPVSISPAQLQQTANYFESRGLTVQVIDTTKWQNIIYFLNGGAVDFTSKEALADFAVTHAVNTIYEMQSSNVVTFTARYGGSCALLATVYTYAVTVS